MEEPSKPGKKSMQNLMTPSREIIKQVFIHSPKEEKEKLLSYNTIQQSSNWVKGEGGGYAMVPLHRSKIGI